MIIFAGAKGYLDKVAAQSGGVVGKAIPDVYARAEDRCAVAR